MVRSWFLLALVLAACETAPSLTPGRLGEWLNAEPTRIEVLHRFGLPDQRHRDGAVWVFALAVDRDDELHRIREPLDRFTAYHLDLESTASLVVEFDADGRSLRHRIIPQRRLR